MTELPPIPTTFTTVIARREFTYSGSGRTGSIVFEIGAPIQDVITIVGTDWRCPVRIVMADGTRLRSACGVDAVQALELSLELIRHELRRLEGTGYRFSLFVRTV